ncbi:hypothetical protein LEP1GSC040_0251 [Leptospira santarosai str. 2000030832]|nr:hypothetical protein LEP1GSC040_0251 [Leptospira santarosai str. 2000030832]
MYRIVVRHEKALGSIFFRPFAEKTLLNGNRRESTARVLSNKRGYWTKTDWNTIAESLRTA